MMEAEVDGARLSEDEIIANLIVTMVGGQETTTNLIGNGLLTLLRNPVEMERLRTDTSLIPWWSRNCCAIKSEPAHCAPRAGRR